MIRDPSKCDSSPDVERVDAVCRAHKWTRKHLAERLGISASQLSRLARSGMSSDLRKRLLALSPNAVSRVVKKDPRFTRRCCQCGEPIRGHKYEDFTRCEDCADPKCQKVEPRFCTETGVRLNPPPLPARALLQSEAGL